MRWAAGASPAEVAALAPHVLAVAADGDQLAQGIADYAARELSQLAICLLPKMDVEPPVPRRGDGRAAGADGRCAGACWPSSREEPALPTDGRPGGRGRRRAPAGRAAARRAA